VVTRTIFSPNKDLILQSLRDGVVTVKFTKKDIDAVTESTTSCDINNANNHIKEIIWFIRRNDMISKYNDYLNYTASPYYLENMGILSSAIINWTNTVRAEHNAEYYNNVQPYYHHTNVPRTGIYSYSFALFPEKISTSGSYNNSKIKTTILLTTKDYSNDDLFNLNQNITKKILDNYSYDVKYEANFYVREINILSVINGSAQLKFV